MISKPRFDISVIVPCYNAEQFVETCINSILMQKNVSVEIIAIDDASSDLTFHILRSMALDHDNLRVKILKKNGGQAAGRNLGFDMAQGDYITYLDSDDFYNDDKYLSKWISTAREYDLDLCVADYQRLNRDLRLTTPTAIDIKPGDVVDVTTAPELVDVSQCWQILYKTSFLKDLGLKFSSKLRQREDRLYFVEALANAKRIGKIADVAIVYRAHDDSTMARVDLDQLNQFTIHMQLLNAALEKSAISKTDSSDFATANAGRYWRQTFTYWKPILEQGIHRIVDADGERLEFEPFFMDYMNAIYALTADADPLFSEQFSKRTPPNDEAKSEGTMDVARIACEHGRYDLFARLLSGDRLHISELLALSETSKFDWANNAVAHYVRFNRGHDFAKNDADDHGEALRSLVDRVVLHIGMPKTGSSAMQEFLELNRLALLKMGIWYPDIGIERGRGVRSNRCSGHSILINRHVHNRGAIGRILAAQLKTLPYKVHTVILSAENIFSDRFLYDLEDKDKNVVALTTKIIDSIDHGNIEVMTALRRQDDWFASYFREVTANPFNKMFDSTRTFWCKLNQLGLFDYDAITDQISKNGNVTKHHIVSAGAMRAAGGSIPWISSVLDIEGNPTIQFDVPRINDSFSDAIAANLLMLKRLNMDRATTSEVFLNVTSNPSLKASSFELISSGEMEEFRMFFCPQLKAFDESYPNESQPVKPKTNQPQAIELDPSIIGKLEFSRRSLACGESSPPDVLHETMETLRKERDLRETAFADIHRMHHESSHMGGELHYMKNSVSWRVTKPLRSAMTLYRTLRKR